MTTILRTMLCMAAALACTLPTATFAQNKTVKKGKLVRIMRNPDGSTTQFSRDPNNTVLESLTHVFKRNGEKILRNRTVYRRDKFGKLRSGQIFDGQRKQLFRIVYGYEKGTGRLIAENIFDARVKRTYPNEPTKEMPVRALRYSYDAQGNRSKPMVFNAPAGQNTEDLLLWLKDQKLDNGTLPQTDPFSKDPVNPNASRVGQ